MAVVKIVNKRYYGTTCVANLIDYVTKQNKTYGLIGAIGMNPLEPKKMIRQMVLVKKIYGKRNGYRQVRHFIVSFSKKEKVTPEMAYFIAYDIAKYYSDCYQICFGVHLDTDHLHIHFVQNTVSYIDGRLYSGAFTDTDHLIGFVSNVLSGYLKSYVAVRMEEFLNDDLEMVSTDS